MPSQSVRPSTVPIDKLPILKSHPLFAKFTPEVLARLCTYVTTRKLKRGTTIFSRGDPGNCLCMVASGTVKVSVQSAGGKDAVFNLINAGGVFGEIALLDGQPRTADALTVTDCQLLILERRDFLPLLDSNPEISLRLIEVLCERIRRTSGQVEDVLFLDLEGRLAKTLLRLMDNARPAPHGRKLTITQREIGQIIGMSRESTNKQLRIWQDRKWLRIERGGITILNSAALAKVASKET